MITFRDLKADEIECRISTVKDKGLSLLLYKDARVDQNILDETVGAENWERDHKELKGNIYCGISIWDDSKKMWVTKWDAGAESYTEKEKGEASDSFKRAGFNWGIGRELYTSPFIWIPSTKCTIKDSGRKDSYGKTIYTSTDKFEVIDIEIKDKKIIALKILNKITGIVCFDWKYKEDDVVMEPVEDRKLNDTEAKRLYKALINKLGSPDNVIEYLDNKYGVDNTSNLMKSEYAEIVREMSK